MIDLVRGLFWAEDDGVGDAVILSVYGGVEGDASGLKGRWFQDNFFLSFGSEVCYVDLDFTGIWGFEFSWVEGYGPGERIWGEFYWESYGGGPGNEVVIE